MKTYTTLLILAFSISFSTIGNAVDNTPSFEEYLSTQEMLVNDLLTDNDNLLIVYLDSLQTLCDNSMADNKDYVGELLKNRNSLIIGALTSKTMRLEKCFDIINNQYKCLKKEDKESFKANLKNQEYLLDAFKNKQKELIGLFQSLEKEHNYLSKKEKSNYKNIFSQQKELILCQIKGQNSTMSVYLASIKLGVPCNNLHKLSS